jgi:hypothetical protein
MAISATKYRPVAYPNTEYFIRYIGRRVRKWNNRRLGDFGDLHPTPITESKYSPN